MPTASPRPPRWLIIVQRDRPHLYRDLHQSFAADGRVQVILDRRQDDRRREVAGVGPDRRRRQRRTGLTARDAELWEHLGLRLFYRDEDMRVYEASADAGPSDAGSTSPVAARPRVLVIDDDPNVRELVSELLGVFGLEVRDAASGTEALALFEASAYDLVVTDLAMPGMTGWGVIEAVRQHHPAPPVIMITGSASTADLARARQEGVTLLLKPVMPEELKRAVERILDTRLEA
jgi:CheY-like chemotaxis protein